MKKNITKREVVAEFKELFSITLSNFKDDRVMKQQLWNDWTDFLCKEGEITERQYNNWSNPF